MKTRALGEEKGSDSYAVRLGLWELSVGSDASG